MPFTLQKIVLASSNAGKIHEIAELFLDLDAEIVAQGDFGIKSPEETGDTFVENALLKARYAAEMSGYPAVADDSGISVDALGGRPGVRSARYAGPGASDEQNLDLLLLEMAGVADDDRGGGFHCAAVLAFPGDEHEPIVAEGVWRGRILRQRLGDKGFGYDPIFLDEAAAKTGAQMSREEKNAVSHRGKAFAELKRKIRERLRSD
jgi:XTP/dITP diphosphohydrolase